MVRVARGWTRSLVVRVVRVVCCASGVILVSWVAVVCYVGGVVSLVGSG